MVKEVVRHNPPIADLSNDGKHKTCESVEKSLGIKMSSNLHERQLFLRATFFDTGVFKMGFA